MIVYVQETENLLPLQKAFPDFMFTPVKSQYEFQRANSAIGIIQNDPNFLINITNAKFRILLLNKENLSGKDFLQVKFDYIDSHHTDWLNVISFIKQSVNQATNKNIIEDLSMNELELFELENEYSKYNKTLLQFKDEEKQRKNNEKKLNHILDFLNLNSGQNNFIDNLCELIWKEVKKNGAFISLSFYIRLAENEGLFIYFNREYVQFYRNIDLLDENLNLSRTKIEHCLGRPFGFPKEWKFHSSSKKAYLFLESKVQNPIVDGLHFYFDQIIDLVILMVEKSYLQQQVKLLMDKWHLFADSYAQPLHVIDDGFNLIQSNYLPSDSNSESSSYLKCYEILASRKTPCESCPVLRLKSKNKLKHDFDYIYTLNKKYKVNSVSFDADKKFYFVFYEDQFEVDQLKSQVMMNEKMHVIGQLANHLAHELNNPLTGLKLMTEFLMDQDYIKTPSVKNDLGEILKGIVRCQSIIADLLQFSSENKSTVTTVYIEDVIKKTIPLLKTITRNHSVFIDVKKVPVQLSLNQTQQVIFNLIKNSCQAMGEKGSIKIYDQLTPRFYDVYFEDSGPGFPVHLKEQMFQAFTTTKVNNDGTGLGLFISKKIMNRMGADLIYDDQCRTGARFILRFTR